LPTAVAMTVRRVLNQMKIMENEMEKFNWSCVFEKRHKTVCEYKALGDKTFAQLSEQQLHVQPNNESNSIAIIIQHLHGNMRSRWTNFLTEDGEKPWRNRDAEFEIRQVKRRIASVVGRRLGCFVSKCAGRFIGA
jgi:hypothetical protein